MNQVANFQTLDSGWKSLYKVGGVAALLAGVLFRRNIAAEISLFGVPRAPVTVEDWFTLLQSNHLLGLAYLNIFDLVNYVLVGLMFLALYAALRRIDKAAMTIAMTACLVGIAIYFASNTAFSLLAVSDQYAAATTDAQRSMLLAAGQALLAINRFSVGSHPGSGGYMSLLLIALAGLITSMIMLRSQAFNRTTAYIGILAGALDLAYCVAFIFLPSTNAGTLAIYFIPAAGLFLMIWHILVGWKLYQLGKKGDQLTAA